MTVKEFSQKYNVSEEKIWEGIRNIYSIAEKPFIMDENKDYSEEAMILFLCVP